ncbi:hypothetical protein [Hydrogenimonas urashimensis]|uniref:hypothetical protein n=1 Tax=Hydrogenimonas urashimensis TaxID=2740515 RepID=UPI00191568A6|nr:hypothetical protein [Hydrogenimonas urashimensis]
MTVAEAAKILKLTPQSVRERMQSNSYATRVLMKFIMSYSVEDVKIRLKLLEELEES